MNKGIHATNTHLCQPGGCRRNSGDARKTGSTSRASTRMRADANAIPKRPHIPQTRSRPFILLSLSRLLNCPRLRVGNSNHAFITPKSRMGKSTNAVPLRYQPMIGGIANVWCNQGIITTRAIHNNNENAPNTTADDKIPIGRGVALPILSILAFFINGSALLPCGIPQHSLCLGLPTVGEGALTANVNDHIIAESLVERTRWRITE
jgi:hypothetical protein